jgi:hypothetical protein
MAVSVPIKSPDMALRRRKRAGKCLTRMRIMPFRIDTVCSGTSCLKATRKPAWIAMPPEIVAVLAHGISPYTRNKRTKLNVQGFLATTQGIERYVKHEAENIRNYGNENNEFCKFVAAPRALEIAAAVEQRQAGDEKAKDILLHEGGGCKGPRVFEGHAGHNGQVGSTAAGAGQGREGSVLRLQYGVEQSEGDEGDEQRARERRYVYSRHRW